jgi:hypothetical protein
MDADPGFSQDLLGLVTESAAGQDTSQVFLFRAPGSFFFGETLQIIGSQIAFWKIWVSGDNLDRGPACLLLSNLDRLPI